MKPALEGEKDMTTVEGILSVACARLVTVINDAPLTDAAKFLDGRHINLVVVCDKGGAMVGIITRTDIVRQMSLCQGCGCTATVTAVMTKDVTFCRPGDLLHDVWLVMKERCLLHVPIVDKDSKPLGVINERDVLRVLFEKEIYDESLLRDYVMGIGYR
jgi:CBS domain-containing protein